MSSTQSLPAGPPPGQNSLPEAQFSGYARRQTMSASESLNAGLTIETKEGDIVTLKSNSYMELNSSMYDSKGVLETESGTAMASVSTREVTLASGESFSFSVQGDLNEQELEDIAAIVLGIDEIISEVGRGDMDDAMETALSMGGYDSVSMYSADISHQRSYSMMSETVTQNSSSGSQPGIGHGRQKGRHAGNGPHNLNAIPEAYRQPEGKMHKKSLKDLFSENKPVNDFEGFLEKVLKELEKNEEQRVASASKPIDKLFKHHLKDLEKGQKDNQIDSALENARKLIGAYISDMIDGMEEGSFKDQFSALSL